MRRTQIYLDGEQDRRLAERARATGRTRSDLIREAVDRLLDQPLDEDEELARFRTAAQAASGSPRTWRTAPPTSGGCGTTTVVAIRHFPMFPGLEPAYRR